MAQPMTLLDLPVDILLLIFPYLDARSFLALTSSCTALHKPGFIHEPLFWSALARTTFRVPNQPVVQNDGQRWLKLYKRLLTQSRVMTWGDNGKGCLGHSYSIPGSQHAATTPTVRQVRSVRQRHISWPQEMQDTEKFGIVSDIQCGGWSTSLLTSKGAICTVGVMDGAEFNRRRPPHMQQSKLSPTLLRFPPGFVNPFERYDSRTAAKQFSVGRGHVLALSDSGRIWSWQNIDHAALHVKFLQHDTMENGKSAGRGVVKKVVAGWNKSAALVEGSGIVVWEPLQRDGDETEIEDAALVLESTVIPKTNYRESASNRLSREENAELADTIGEVTNFTVLENVMLFATSLGKVFASVIIWSNENQRMGDPVELTFGDSANRDESFATDVQGSFRNFAIFTRSGAVLTSHQDRLMEMVQGQDEMGNLFTRVPALQHKDVISVAFGDYHFHALHAPGYITSYGYEPQACGALGLGGHGYPEGRLRGIRYQGIGGDGRLVPHAYTQGRRVWFEPEKKQWITFLTSGGANAAEAAERLRMAIGSPDLTGQGEVSEWVEQEGRNWEQKFGLEAEDDDGLGAYFALSVTAAGWHSGALVLKNEHLASKISQVCEVPDKSATTNTPPEGSSEQPTEVDSDTDAAATSSSNADNVSHQLSPSLLARTLSTALDYGRYFLGVGPYSAASNVRQATAQPARQAPDPKTFGASPREGYSYVWAGDHFPRLKLSDGRDMPGEVEFDEWRYGRPEWELGFSL